jgi:hypothetical protein
MKENYTQQQQNFIKAQKKVKGIIGFYTHLGATLFIIPFIIFINLKTVPQYHWFWFFIGAWVLGILFHWLIVFRLSKFTLRKEWEQKKIKEIMKKGNNTSFEESDYTQELFYMKSKKRVKEIKGFYAFLIVNIISIPLIIYINLKFSPGFHFFWFAVIGLLFALFMMWLGIFGFPKLGLGSDWQKKKIKEIMEENNKHKNELYGSK